MLEDLMKRVEAATGPDRELDARIFAALLGPPGLVIKQSPFNFAWCAFDARGRLWEKPDPFRRLNGITDCTTAALALVERAMPGYCIEIEGPILDEGEDGPALFWSVALHDNEGNASIANADTLPLAILTSLLRAKIAQEAKDA
jgi:hypothetical protein